MGASFLLRVTGHTAMCSHMSVNGTCTVNITAATYTLKSTFQGLPVLDKENQVSLLIFVPILATLSPTPNLSGRMQREQNHPAPEHGNN